MTDTQFYDVFHIKDIIQEDIKELRTDLETIRKSFYAYLQLSYLVNFLSVK
jgi:hypothetical protein